MASTPKLSVSWLRTYFFFSFLCLTSEPLVIHLIPHLSMKTITYKKIISIDVNRMKYPQLPSSGDNSSLSFGGKPRAAPKKIMVTIVKNTLLCWQWPKLMTIIYRQWVKVANFCESKLCAVLSNLKIFKILLAKQLDPFFLQNTKKNQQNFKNTTNCKKIPMNPLSGNPNFFQQNSNPSSQQCFHHFAPLNFGKAVFPPCHKPTEKKSPNL